MKEEQIPARTEMVLNIFKPSRHNLQQKKGKKKKNLGKYVRKRTRNLGRPMTGTKRELAYRFGLITPVGSIRPKIKKRNRKQTSKRWNGPRRGHGERPVQRPGRQHDRHWDQKKKNKNKERLTRENLAEGREKSRPTSTVHSDFGKYSSRRGEGTIRERE